MNKARRSTLKAILGQIEELTTTIEEVQEVLQGVLDEEEEALGNLTESLHEGERGQQMQEYIDALEGAIDSLSELDTNEIYQTIEEIAEG